MLFLIFTIVLAAMLIVPLLVFKDRQRLILIVASFVPIAFVIARLIFRAAVPGELTGDLHIANILQGLPLQMCGIAAFLLPAAAITRNRIVFGITFFFSMPGALLALLLDSTASVSFGDFEMWAFYVPHVLYLIMPPIIAGFKYITPKFFDIVWVILCCFLIITVVHFVNLLINDRYGPMTVNFIFTLFPGDSVATTGEFVELPILGTFFRMSGETPYFYLLMFAPVLAAIDALIGLPFLMTERKARRADKNLQGIGSDTDEKKISGES